MKVSNKIIEKHALMEEHIEVLIIVIAYYEQYELLPTTRTLIRLMREELGNSKGSSLHLMRLFTGKPMHKIADLLNIPKPNRCFDI